MPSLTKTKHEDSFLWNHFVWVRFIDDLTSGLIIATRRKSHHKIC